MMISNHYKSMGKPSAFCWRELVTLLAVLFLVPLSAAQAEGILDIYQQAIKNDPAYQGAQFSHDASKETLAQARSAFLPKISAEGAYTGTHQNVGRSDNTSYTPGSSSYPTTEYSVSLIQPLFNKSSLSNLFRAQAKVKGADMELEAARQDLIVRVTKVYLGVLAARDKLNLAQTEEASIRMQYELAYSKYSLGLARKTDYLDAKARLAEVRANRIAAESALDGALQALREVTGKKAASLAPLRSDLPLKRPEPGEADAWIAAAVKQNPAIEVQRQSVEMALQEYKRQVAGHYPVLNLEAKYSNIDTQGTLFGGGYEAGTSNVLVRLNFPIFEGGVVNSRSREAYNLYQASLQEQERQLRALQKETRAAYHGVLDAMERVAALREAVEAQELLVQAKQDGYRSGLYILVAVLDAQRDLTRGRQDYATARYDYVMNSLRLKKAAGTLAEGDMVTVQGWLEDSK